MSAVLRRIHRKLLPTEAAQAFFAWSLGSYVLISAVVLAFVLQDTGGTLIYALDDPAIHLVIAENLVHHGTWGVEPGHFQSASSSPLWTVLLGAFVFVLPFLADWAALILNALAAVAVLVLLARHQDLLHPSRRRPWHVAATFALSVFVLFLPAATFVGMEHLLHAALVLAVLHLVTHPAGPGASRLRRVAPYGLLALAALTRLESAFLAAGLGAALVAECLPHAGDAEGDRPGWRDRVPTVVGLGLAAGLPIAAFAAFNKAMGQSWLPNSVIAKSPTLNRSTSGGIDLVRIFERFTQDGVVAVLVVLCAALVAVGWRDRRSWVTPALAVVLTAIAHVAFASIGWYERYQVYLIVLALGVLLAAARELLPEVRRAERPHLGAVLVLLLLLVAVVKVDLTTKVPRAVGDTYQQRYQAARFLARYYDGVPVATGELGYISLEHDGPITDLYGLGDFEVMQARRTYGQEAPPEYWAQLAEERGFPIAAVYPATLLYETPPEWILVASWTLPHKAISGFDDEFQFWATTPEAVAPMIEHLEEFAAELPDEVTQEIQGLAQLRADTMLAEGGP